MLKTITMLAAIAITTLLFTGTGTAQEAPEPAPETIEQPVRELDGFWTPIPDSPEYRTDREDLKKRQFHTTQPETRAF